MARSASAGMTPRGGCGLAVQVPTQVCASAERLAWTPSAVIRTAIRTARFENMVPSTLCRWWRLTRLAHLRYIHSDTSTSRSGAVALRAEAGETIAEGLSDRLLRRPRDRAADACARRSSACGRCR